MSTVGPSPILLHVLDANHVWTGLYFWEYVTSLSYDWKYLIGRKERRWTTWIYLGCRFMTAVSLSLLLVLSDLNTQTRFNCLPLYDTAAACSYIAFQLASLLVVLRTLVVWNYWRPIVAFVVAGWTTNLVVMIWSIIGASAAWVQNAIGGQCVSLFDARNNRVLEIVSFCIDTVLVLCMLVGLSRKKDHHGPSSGLWTKLYRQAIIWLGVVLLAELPALVLTVLDLEDALHQLLLLPKVIIITISATRMYRSLNRYLVRDATHQKDHLVGGSETAIALGPVSNIGRRGLSFSQPLVVNVHTEQIQYTSDTDEATQAAARPRGTYIYYENPGSL